MLFSGNPEVVAVSANPWWSEWPTLAAGLLGVIVGALLQAWLEGRRHHRQKVRDAYSLFSRAVHQRSLARYELDQRRHALRRADTRVALVQATSASSVENEREQDRLEIARRGFEASELSYRRADNDLQVAVDDLRGLLPQDYLDLAEKARTESMVDMTFGRTLAFGVSAITHPVRSQRRKDLAGFRQEVRRLRAEGSL